VATADGGSGGDDRLVDVVYEDDDLLVIDKPAGLVCHPTRDGERSSLIGRVRLHLGHREGRLVNRLDRETSGIVLVAKNALVARELGKLFASGDVQKIYEAVVHGHLAGDCTIEEPLGRDEGSAVAIKDCVRADGAPARTEVRLVRTFSEGELPFSAIEVRPRTGRKHQIRIHLAYIGHPIVGDKIYGADPNIYLRFVTRTMTEGDRALMRVECQLLRAREILFRWRGREWGFRGSAERDLGS
jgi:23S rRNA pseudouridine1911/1915/1917 synthase